jgi:hypothetical protein
MYKFYKKIKKSELSNWAREIVEYSISDNSLSDIVNDYNFKIVDHINCDNGKIYGQVNHKHKIIYIALTAHQNLAQLIDTISHEIAHILVNLHNRKHTKYKMAIKKVIKTWINYLEALNNYYQSENFMMR